MRSLKLIAAAALITGLTVSAQAQTGKEQSVGADRQDRVEQGMSPAPADSLGGPVVVAPRGTIIETETNGRRSGNQDATEGSVGTDRSNAIRRGDDPSTSQR
jgi:hypothetical protein